MIQTDRLILKRIGTTEDLDALLAIYNKVENMKYIQSGKYNWTRDELAERYGLEKESKDPCGYFAVKLKEQDLIIGEAGIFNSFQSDTKMEIGYIIDYEFHKKGYGSEVCSGLVDHIMNRLGYREVIARMYEENIASIRVCEKNGFQLYEKGQTENGKGFRVYRFTKRSL